MSDHGSPSVPTTQGEREAHLPTEPTWGILVARSEKSTGWLKFNRWVCRNGWMYRDCPRSPELSAASVVDFIALTKAQVRRIEKAHA